MDEIIMFRVQTQTRVCSVYGIEVHIFQTKLHCRLNPQRGSCNIHVIMHFSFSFFGE